MATATPPRPTGIAPGAPDFTGYDLVLLGVVGSTAYGLSHEGSDTDRLGAYLAPPRDVLGMRGQAVTSMTRVTSAPQPDSAIHELGKLCSLALKGNPTVLELLYLPEYEVCSDAGAQLIALRSSFLSTPAVLGAYGGYATQQADRLLRRANEGQEGFGGNVSSKRTEKHGRHCMRLLRQARQLVATGTLRLDMSAIREELFAAGRLAASDPEAFRDLFTTELAALDNTTSVLPDAPDAAAIETFLIETRLAQLGRL